MWFQRKTAAVRAEKPVEENSQVKTDDQAKPNKRPRGAGGKFVKQTSDAAEQA